MNQSNEYVSKWKQNEPKEPLNVVDTRTFAERVEEALTIEAFRAWLESKWSDEIVGRACNSQTCPIHEFLEPHFRKQIKECGARLQVLSTEIIIRADSRRAEAAYVPEFANKFIVKTDTAFRSPMSEDDGLYPPVTAEQALAILAEVEKELADTSEKGEG